MDNPTRSLRLIVDPEIGIEPDPLTISVMMEHEGIRLEVWNDDALIATAQMTYAAFEMTTPTPLEEDR